MTIAPLWIGIDVSKTRLDVYDPRDQKTFTVPNTQTAVAAMAARWAKDAAGVAFEATGSYDLVLRRTLEQADVMYRRLNPSRVRAFATALGRRVKTDPVDAQVIATMAASLQTQAPEQPDPDREHLTVLVRRRDQLVAMRAQERTRMSEAEPEPTIDSYRRIIALLDDEIADYDNAIADLVARSRSLRSGADRLQSVPGVGPVTATILLALLPELGSRDPKRIAALVGLAPFNRDSGSFQGARRIAGGRARVRRALYMAALSASRNKGRFATFYTRLISAGKPKKLALIAVARKLLVTLNAMARDDTTYKTA